MRASGDGGTLQRKEVLVYRCGALGLVNDIFRSVAQVGQLILVESVHEERNPPNVEDGIFSVDIR